MPSEHTSRIELHVLPEPYRTHGDGLSLFGTRGDDDFEERVNLHARRRRRPRGPGGHGPEAPGEGWAQRVRPYELSGLGPTAWGGVSAQWVRQAFAQRAQLVRGLLTQRLP